MSTDNRTPGHTPGRTPRRRRTVRKLNPIRLTLVIGFFIALFGIGSALGLVLYSAKDMPAWDPTALQPNLPSFLYDKDGNEIAKIFVENRVPVEFKNVPDSVKSAFLSIEDIRFYDHNGLDLRRIAGAVLADVKAGSKAQGASTITQQLVKRAFLSPEKSWKRKIQEALLAVQLERRFTKDQIFEMYLNQIYFGEGAYGIQSAAQVYFGKEAKDLSLEEAALLASLPKAPSTYDPFKNMEAAVKRRNLVLNSMARYKFISEAKAEEAQAKPIVLAGTKAKDFDKYKFPYFVDYVSEILINKYGENKVYKGGLKVYTTLDPKIQTYAEEAMSNNKNFPKTKVDDKGVAQPQAAVVVLDPNTGSIKAIVGGRDHKQKRQFNRATDALRQPGSTFKPIVAYGPAIERGKAPADVAKDEPYKNFENYDGKYRGMVTYRKAVALSINTVAVKVMQDTGVEKSLSFARKLGISTLVSSESNAKRNDENLSSALGGLTKGVSPLEMAGAYGTFANQGVYVQPLAITMVKDHDGNIIDQFKPKKNIAMKKTTAYLITDMLRSAVTSGTAASASLGGRPVAGKTGTTSDDKDAWFAGYTPELVTVVWMGHDDPKQMRKVYGGSYPAKIWKYIMSNSLKGVPVKNFDRPAGIVSATVCTKSGDKPGPDCPKDVLASDLFARGTVPSKICDGHTYVNVCSDSNQLPTDRCPTVVSMSFAKGEEPTETCDIHKGNAVKEPTGIPVCTDPSHGGIAYLALVPGPGQEGGCPKGSVKYQQFPAGQEPTAYCPLLEHQLKDKPVVTPPQSPDTQQVPPVTAPQVDKPRGPKKEKLD